MGSCTTIFGVVHELVERMLPQIVVSAWDMIVCQAVSQSADDHDGCMHGAPRPQSHVGEQFPFFRLDGWVVTEIPLLLLVLGLYLGEED